MLVEVDCAACDVVNVIQALVQCAKAAPTFAKDAAVHKGLSTLPPFLHCREGKSMCKVQGVGYLPRSPEQLCVPCASDLPEDCLAHEAQPGEKMSFSLNTRGSFHLSSAYVAHTHLCIGHVSQPKQRTCFSCAYILVPDSTLVHPV